MLVLTTHRRKTPILKVSSIYLTNPKVQTLQVYITSLNASNDGTNFPAIMTGAFLASLPMIIIFFCFQDLFINSIAMTGSKED